MFGSVDRMRVVVTGAAGFVGSLLAERFAQEGHRVLAFDDIDHFTTSAGHYLGPSVARYNWDRLARKPSISREEADVRDPRSADSAVRSADLIVHADYHATATASLEDPRADLGHNLLGTFNVLEAARRHADDSTLVFLSSHKVYGDAVNEIPQEERTTRYEFTEPAFRQGIPERFPTDRGAHTPYGASKLAADLYVQEYGRTYGMRTCVFRTSSVYGPRQFGTADAGWMAHFVLSGYFRRPVTVHGDGKQVRDLLFGDDLADAVAAYVARARQLGSRVYNVGGGPSGAVSLLEFLRDLEFELGRRPAADFAGWRPADQRVFIANNRKAREELGWTPTVGPEEGLRRVLAWVDSGPFQVTPPAREPGGAPAVPSGIPPFRGVAPRGPRRRTH